MRTVGKKPSIMANDNKNDNNGNSGLQALGTVLSVSIMVATIMYFQSTIQSKANTDLLARIVELERHERFKGHQALVGHPGVLEKMGVFDVKFTEVETKFEGERAARISSVERLDDLISLQFEDSNRRIDVLEIKLDKLPEATGRLSERLHSLEEAKRLDAVRKLNSAINTLDQITPLRRDNDNAEQ